ncbi:glycoside hydrolase family 43 protein [Acidomyces richmondensis BFW]|nr:glycoside hydrolase family 43 protein [Acidomyces richmondensis BFW]
MGQDKMLIATQGLLAPTIRHDQGTFYVICTNSRSNGSVLTTENFYVSTTNIWSGTWSPPVYYNFCGIDPSLFFDDDGRVYIQGSHRAGLVWDPQCTIRQLEIDIATGEPLSDICQIWEGAMGKQDVEGPHIYKKDDYYYLLAAEAGTFENHAITMARSKDIWGPYTSYPRNPVLTARGTSEVIQNTGHGDLFQSPDGSWWCVCLGVRKIDIRHPLGRETFLAPVDWPRNEWPSIAHPKLKFQTVSSIAPERDIGPMQPINPNYVIENIFIRGQNPSSYVVAEPFIRIKPGVAGLDSRTSSVSFLGRRQRSINSTASVKLLKDFWTKKEDGLIAGLSLWKDEQRYVAIAINQEATSIDVVMSTVRKGHVLVEREAIGIRDGVELQIVATAYKYTFAVRPRLRSDWRTVASINTNELATYDFTGPVFGIFAQKAEQQRESSWVTFTDFVIT